MWVVIDFVFCIALYGKMINTNFNFIYMKQLFAIFFVCALCVCNAACEECVLDAQCVNVEQKSRVPEQRVQNLIRQAREGDAEAYKELVLCYHDGDGVEKSWINMMCMHAMYCEITESEFYDFSELFDEDDPYRLLIEVLTSSKKNDRQRDKLARLKEVAPIEAMTFDLIKDVHMDEDAVAVIESVREAEKEGSELAVLFQAVCYTETDYKQGREEFLARVVEKNPLFNLILGDFYLEKCNDANGIDYISRSVECYYKADAHALLVPKYAKKLLRIYNEWGEKGLSVPGEEEIARLKKLSEIY